MNIGIVSCVKQKQEHRAPAEELYISDWFQKTLDNCFYPPKTK